jgi:hypothetical protein
MVLRAYLMIRTLNRTSNEIVETIRHHYEQHFIAGSTVYGWYDVFIDLDITSHDKLTTIIKEFLHDQLNVTHNETTIEMTPDQLPGAPLLA